MALNSSQLRAVKSQSEIVSVVAGAGSGKTKVLVESIIELIDRGVPAGNILAITFTNKAAKEARERVQNNDVTVCTIHSWCMRILRTYKKGLTIWDDDDAEKAMEITMQRFGMPYNREVVKAIDYSLNTLAPMEPEILPIYEAYVEYMRKCNAIDFSHMLVDVFNMLHNDYIRKGLQQRYQYILVDEYQDVSRLQHETIKLIRSKYLFVVGDPWQSIYGFRGGKPEYMEEWFNHPASDSIILDTNYRNSERLNTRAQILMGEQRVKNCMKEGHDVNIWLFGSSADEADYVISQIRRMDTRTLGRSAILYRTHGYSKELVSRLYASGVPFHIHGQMMLFRRKVIKDVMAYLKLSINNQDDMSFLRIVNVPKRGMGDKKLDVIKNRSISENIPMYNAAMEEYPDKLELFHKAITEISNTKTTYRKIEIILDLLGHDNVVIERELLSLAEGHNDINEFMEFVDIYDNPDPKDRLHLMTVHASKGLEFEHVFVIGFNEGTLPLLKNDISEERRIAYVAMTRAIDSADLCAVKGVRSRFIGDMVNENEWDYIVRG